MEDIYTFTLSSEEFEKLMLRKKTVQIVLNDSKHSVYEVGNKLKFVKKAEGEDASNTETESVEALIENLLYFSNLNDLFDSLGKEKCGYKPYSTTEKASDKFLSQERYELIEKNGLIAIIFKVIEG